MSSELRDSDGALVLEKGEAALVTSRGMTDIALMIPAGLADEDHMPDAVVFLAAMLVKFHHDPEFVQDQIEEFRSKKN